MSYPASWPESNWRNPVDKVSAFFNEKYDKKYWIINVSERATYDKQRYFQGRVTDYHWPDHHGPPFTFLFGIAEQAYKWIISDKQNVVVIHCNSGKGRTGTAICSIMLYMGFFNNVDDCLRFFGHQRFTCGKGVSQPC
jgi:protein-tyrosine phosphatase